MVPGWCGLFDAHCCHCSHKCDPCFASFGNYEWSRVANWFHLVPGISNHPHTHLYSWQSESDQPIGLWVPKHEARLNNPRALREIKNPSNNDKSSRQAKRRRRTTTDSQTMMGLARPGQARQAGRQTDWWRGEGVGDRCGDRQRASSHDIAVVVVPVVVLLLLPLLILLLLFHPLLMDFICAVLLI